MEGMLHGVLRWLGLALKDPLENGKMGFRGYPDVLTPAEPHDRGDRGFVVSLSDVPEAVTQGDDETKAPAEAMD